MMARIGKITSMFVFQSVFTLFLLVYTYYEEYTLTPPLEASWQILGPNSSQ